MAADSLLRERGLYFEARLHLGALGLLSYADASLNLDKGITGIFIYCGKSYHVGVPSNRDVSFDATLVTDVGKELFPLCEPKPDEKYLSISLEGFAAHGLDVQELELASTPDDD
jgi:hypothetical protein